LQRYFSEKFNNVIVHYLKKVLFEFLKLTLKKVLISHPGIEKIIEYVINA